jgi:mono/diheme cytochrome c family protein
MRWHQIVMRTTLVVAAALLLGCGKKSEDKPPVDTQAQAEASHIFHTLCITCHGEGGKGDGSASATLNPKPRNYTDKAWQAKTTDDQIKQIILLGGAGVGKSPMMPASPQLQNEPAVVDELVKIVRSFGA